MPRFTTGELIQKLENSGYDWRRYSGRFMYGAECVGVYVEDSVELWRMAAEIGPEFSDDVQIDSLGRGWIVYWPHARLSSTREIA
mgnify:CR=1 FL=1